MAALTLDALSDLMRHMEWADACVWRAVRAHPAAAQDARVRDLLLHLHGVQRHFLGVWTGRAAATALPAAAAWTPAAAQAAVRAYYHDLFHAVGSFDDAALHRSVAMPGIERYEEQMGRRFEKPSLGETMLQVATHSTYHRGQVNARLKELGAEPPLVDYIAWIYSARPVPEWPS
jgi:uncharacterized damage-inducible protein DinB